MGEREGKQKAGREEGSSNRLVKENESQWSKKSKRWIQAGLWKGNSRWIEHLEPGRPNANLPAQAPSQGTEVQGATSLFRSKAKIVLLL